MKHCPQCKKTYDDSSLNFCLEDGSKLTFFDTEAETLRNITPKAEMSPQDIRMEITNFLTSKIARGTRTLIRFDELMIALDLTIKQISENFEPAAEAAECEIIGEKTETRVTVRRESTRLVRA